MKALLFHPVPELSLWRTGGEVKLSSFQGRYLVLYFYPKANTPGCTREAQEFSALLPEFQRLDAQVVGVSRDQPEVQARFVERHGLAVAMLSDPEGEAHRAFGAVKEGGGVRRSTFLIDRAGVLRHAWPKVRVGGHAEEVLSILRTLYEADLATNPLIVARRARRALADRPVPEGLLVGLVQAAHLAPSCFNNQPWRLVVATGEALEGLKEALAGGNYWAKRAPAMIAVASKPELDCRLSDGRDYFLLGCGMAVGFLMLQATQLGLIAHPIAGYDPVKAKAALGIPEDHVLITLVVVGWPGPGAGLSEKHRALESSPRDRKPLSEVAFWGRYGQGIEPPGETPSGGAAERM